MLTLPDLRYLLRLVQCDAIAGTNIQRSRRVEGKLVEVIGRVRRKDTIVDANISTTNDRSCCIQFGGHTLCTGVAERYVKGGKGMAGKTSKAAPKMPKGKIGKAVKKK